MNRAYRIKALRRALTLIGSSAARAQSKVTSLREAKAALALCELAAHDALAVESDTRKALRNRRT
jgi:hypothetical protein